MTIQKATNPNNVAPKAKAKATAANHETSKAKFSTSHSTDKATSIVSAPTEAIGARRNPGAKA